MSTELQPKRLSKSNTIASRSGLKTKYIKSHNYGIICKVKITFL